MVIAGTFQGDPFWDPVPFSWPVLGLLLVGVLVLTLGVVVWTVLQPDEPAADTTELVDRAVDRDRTRAQSVTRRMDAESGRADAADPELR